MTRNAVRTASLLLGAVVLVTATSVVLTHDASSASRNASSLTRRSIEAFLSLRPGETKAIYVVRGRRGPIGQFTVACSRSTTPSTAYAVRPLAADSLVAVDGRGVSRGAVVLPGRSIRGASGPAGLEQWAVRMSRKPEDVTVDATLTALGKSLYGPCTFWLQGSMTVLAR